MALLTISKESALVEARISALIRLHRLVGKFGLCPCELHVTRHSSLTRLAQNGDHKAKMLALPQSHEIDPR